jgi:hypothetical protein
MVADARCAAIKTPDFYMAEVDRKGFISRLASAFGTGAGLIIFLVARGRRRS